MSSARPVAESSVLGDKRSLLTLADEARRDEERVEKYGGDDPEDPPPQADTKAPAGEVKVQPVQAEPDPNLVTWSPGELDNPHNWSRRYKWFVTLLNSFMLLNVTFASSAPTAGAHAVAEALHSSNEISYLITALFLFGYVVGPIFWGPGSEMFGRRPVVILTMTCHTLLHLGQSRAPNMQTLLITRFLGGFFASGPLNNAGGVLADTWDALDRGPATSVMFTCIFIGPALGPLVGGFVVSSYLGWRWVFWVMMIFAATCAICAILFFPETYTPVLLAKKARRLRKADPVANKDLYAESERHPWTLHSLLERTLFRPFIMLSEELILVLVTLYLSVVYGIIYALFQIIPFVFARTRHFTVSQTGLIFIGVGTGCTLGAGVNYLFSRHYPRLMKTWRGFPPPEERLLAAMAAGPLLVIGIFWLGWTGNYESVPWYVPMLSTIPIGMAVNMLFMSFLSYLVDTYLMYAASAFAANTMIRSGFAAAFPLFTTQMFEGMGTNWAATLLGLLAAALAPIPFLFYKYGARIRQNSHFAPCLDLKIAKTLAEERAAAGGEKQEV